MVAPCPEAAVANSRLRSGQNGSAKAMWPTIPLSKKVAGRDLVRSMSWSGITKSSGRMLSLRLPTALTDTMRSTPSDLSA